MADLQPASENKGRLGQLCIRSTKRNKPCMDDFIPNYLDYLGELEELEWSCSLSVLSFDLYNLPLCTLPAEKISPSREEGGVGVRERRGIWDGGVLLESHDQNVTWLS
ncbi:uncharacterized [Tachysurus ichikawai]